jgi:hypothetical protein
VKIIKTALELVTLIVLLAILIPLYSLKRLPADHPINLSVRDLVLPHKMLVKAFRLNQIGDARYQLTDPKNSPLRIQISHPAKFSPSSQIENWLQTNVSASVGKTGILLPPNTNLTAAPVSDKHLLELTTTDLGDNYDLHVIFLPSSSDFPTNSGRTVSSKSIFIFYELIESLSSDVSIQNRLYQSTISHELGHLLGLEHVSAPNCIMSATVEVYENRVHQAGNIPLKFCIESLAQINQLIESHQ